MRAKWKTLVMVGAALVAFNGMKHQPQKVKGVRLMGDFLEVDTHLIENGGVRVLGPHGELYYNKLFGEVSKHGLSWKIKDKYYVLLSPYPTAVVYYTTHFLPLKTQLYVQEPEPQQLFGYRIDGELPQEYIPTLKRYYWILQNLNLHSKTPRIYIHYPPHPEIPPYAQYQIHTRNIQIIYKPGHAYMLSHELAHHIYDLLPAEKKQKIEEMWKLLKDNYYIISLAECYSIPGAAENAGHPWDNPSELFASAATFVEWGSKEKSKWTVIIAHDIIREILGKEALKVLKNGPEGKE